MLNPNLRSDSILSSWLALEVVCSLWEEVVCVPAFYIVCRVLFCAAVKDKDIQLLNVNHLPCIKMLGRFKLIQEAICLAASGNGYFSAIEDEILCAVE